MVQAQGASDILLTYKGSVTIRQQDIDTLRDGYWLNDSIMTLALDYIVDQQVKGTNLEGKVHPFDASAAKYMNFCDDDDLREMYGPLNLAEKLVVFVPLNDATSTSGGGSHWALLAVVRDEDAG